MAEAETSPLAITIEDIEEARDLIRPYVHRTPVLTSTSFDKLVGNRAFFKAENFQRGGSFKVRGATNRLAHLTPEERARGVVAFSSGNHAQGVALAAGFFGVPATIVMPTDAPRAKVAATRAYGAEIVFYDRMKEDREAIAAKLVEQGGQVLVPPYDHPQIMAGQGTATLELAEQVADLDVLLAPVGGGGLLSGSAVAAKALNPRIRIFGVETVLSNDTWQSLRKGERIRIPPPDTIADGMRTLQPGAFTFPVVQRLVEDILLVSDEEVIETMRWLLTRMKILVEPTGAVAAAALLHVKLPIKGARVGVILSGGNVDPEVLREVL